LDNDDRTPVTIEEAPSYAPEGASGASIASEDDEDYSSFFDEIEFEEFGEGDEPAEFLDQGIPDLPIRAAPKDWRRLLAWIGETYGPSVLKQATAAKRAGTLTIEMIQNFGEHAEDVA
jgi:hypothetical protein